MRSHCFAYDYGVLPGALLTAKEILTPADLMDTPAWHTLSSLCIGQASNRPSLYEHFINVCQMLSELDGHPMKKDLLSLWQAKLPELPLPSKETADFLWKTLTDRFFLERTARESFLPGAPWNCVIEKEHLSMLPTGAAPMPDCNAFLATEACNCADWEREIDASLEAFLSAGAKQIILTLPRTFAFSVPDVYHVNCTLASQKRTVEQQNLLLSQLLREVASYAKRNDLSMLLRVLCNGAAVEAACSYLGRTVGMPDLIWTTPDVETAKGLLSFSRPESGVSPGILISDVPTEGELQSTLAAYAARYPIGALQILTGADATLLEYAQARVMNTLKEVRKNL